MSEEKKYADMSDSEKKKEDWMNSKWRPMMGWSYMATCITDFVIFPVLWSVLQSISKGQVNMQWQPITLQGAGLYHIAMGAVLGIAAYGRTKEKLDGVAGGSNFGTQYVPPPAPGATPGFGTPTRTTVTQTFGSQPAGGFDNSMGGGFNNPSMGGGFGSMSPSPMTESPMGDMSGGAASSGKLQVKMARPPQ